VDVPKPDLLWSLQSAVRGTVSLAYQVQMFASSSSVDPDPPLLVSDPIWDTGRVRHCACPSPCPDCVPESHVVYAGPALQSATAYHWRVRWWSNSTADGAVTPSSWSTNASLVTGLFNTADWRDS
jgi:alpha-L-rhamnosidase